MLQRTRLIIMLLCVCLATPAALAQDAGRKTIGPREPLAYRDSGIYGWWQPDLWEGPFDFLVTQAIVIPGDFTGSEGTNNATELEHIRSSTTCRVPLDGLARPGNGCTAI